MKKNEKGIKQIQEKKIGLKTPSLNKKIDFPYWGSIQNKTIYFVIFLFVLAFVLRVFNVGYLALWLDEYMHVSTSISVLNGGTIFQEDNNGIFLTVIMIGLFKVFGATEFVARMPSVLFGSFSIILTFLLAKRLYNSKIGLLAALLNALSLYTIFWSRIARNYASFEFAFLLLIIIFLLAFEHKPNKDSDKNNFWTKNKINRNFLFVLPIAFLFSVVNHLLTIFVIFSFCFYFSIVAIKKIIKREEGAFLNKYSLILYPSFLMGVLFFSPYLETIAKPLLLNTIVPERSIGFYIPDWGYIIEQLKGIDRFKSFNVYYDVIRSDYAYLHFIGIIGIVFAFIENKKSGLFLFSMFIIPLLVMSFIYREPYLSHYLLYIYPFFLIYMAIGVYSIFQYLFKLLFKDNVYTSNKLSRLHLILCLLLILIFTPFKEIKALITNKAYGQVVKKELFNSTFVNWKEPCLMLKPYIQKNDKVFATWYQAANFYLDIDNSIRFRQRYYNAIERRYMDNPATNQNNNAASYEDFVRTFQNSERGWLLADYYFDNVFTDPRARDFAIKNMTYHFNFCPSSEIKVFSWDKTKPRTQPENTLLIEVGKDKNRPLSDELTFNINNFNNSSIVQIFIEAEGIDNNDEAVVVINGTHTQFITKKDANTGIIEINPSQRRVFTETLDKSWFKETGNTIQFGYNAQTRDIKPGFVIYNIAIQAN